MADVPQTLAEWAAHGAVDAMSREVINTLVENDRFLGEVPLVDWPGVDAYEWTLNKTLPTVGSITSASTLESTAAARYKAVTYLSQYGGDIEVPIHPNSTMDKALSMLAEELADLSLSAHIRLATEIIQGGYMTEANVTIASQWDGTANLGFDAVTAVSANMPAGYGWVTYTHTGTTLKFRAPGSTSYGAAVDISGGDGDFTLYDGDDTTKSVTVTVDISDLTADKDGVAFTFQRPEATAGLKELAALDSNQVVTPSANGDAITLTMLDELEEMVIGPKSEKRFLMNKRTRRAVKTLIAAAGGMKQGEFQGLDLSKYEMNYEGVPIMASPGVVVTETQGTSSGNCGRVYCVRVNKNVGFHGFYGPHIGPNFGTAAAVSDYDAEGGLYTSPVYLRNIGERENSANIKWRLTCAIAFCLKRSKSCAMRYGITS